MPSAEDEAEITPEWWNATLTSAWIETRMEADRTMVALSAGGIGLLVTLLTAFAPQSTCVVIVYILALLAFSVAIACGIAIFKRNAAHLEEALNSPATADNSSTRRDLGKLDWVLGTAFGAGVVFSILTGVVIALGATDVQRRTPVQEAEDVRQGESVERDETRAGSHSAEESGGNRQPIEADRRSEAVAGRDSAQ